MSKKSIIAILMMIFSVGIISMYSTYALEEEMDPLGESTSDDNLIYSISEYTNKQLSLMAGETKFIDIELTNTYDNTIKYGMYYYAVNPEVLPNNVLIKLADGSVDPLEETIEPGKERIVSLEINNNSEYNIILMVGALIGFENGDIRELETDKQILIK